MSDVDTAAIRYVVAYDSLCIETGKCTCGGARGYPHESGCGLEQVAPLDLIEDVLRERPALLAEVARLREAVDNVRAALLEGGQTAAIRSRNALAALSSLPETLESENR